MEVYNDNCVDEQTNIVLLEELFERLPVTLLKSCRLVCRQWRQRSLFEWRKRAVLCIIGNGSQEPPRPPITDTAKLSVVEWNEMLSREDDEDLLYLRAVPFRSFKIMFCSEWGMAETSLIEQSGPSIRQLEFEKCDFKGLTKTFEDFLYDFAPNLEKLVFDTVTFTFSGEVKAFQYTPGKRNLKCIEYINSPPLPEPFSWPEFIRTVENLRELSLPKVSVSTYYRILKTIAEIRSRDQRKFQLRRLSFSTGIGDTGTLPQDISKIVRELNFPLKHVSLDLLLGDFSHLDNCRDHEAEVYFPPDKQILEACKNTLEEIRIGHMRIYWPWVSKQVFPSLKKFELSCKWSVDCRDLWFLRGMPNLKELILKSGFSLEDPYDSDTPFLSVLPEPYIFRPRQNLKSAQRWIGTVNISSFHFVSFHRFYAIPDKTVEIIVKLMSNLKRLTIPVTETCNLSKIFAHLNQLEELKILYAIGMNVLGDDTNMFRDQTYFDNYDQVLTGYSSMTNEEGIHGKIGPGISDLKNLKSFALLALIPTTLTDFTFSFGFLRMPHLQSLRIVTSNDEISEEMRSKINNSTFQCRIVVVEQTEYSSPEIACEFHNTFFDVNSEGRRCWPAPDHHCEHCSTH